MRMNMRSLWDRSCVCGIIGCDPYLDGGVIGSFGTGGVWLDDMTVSVIFLDLIVIYLLLIGTERSCGGKCVHLRVFFASLTAASYSGAVASGRLISIDQDFGRMIVLIISGLIAFGVNNGTSSKISIFLLLDSALDGIMNGRGMTSAVQRLSVTAVIVSICCMLRRNRRGGKSYSHIKIRFRDKTHNIDALRDTGNDLVDILTGARVLVVAPDTAYRLTGLGKEELADPLKTMENSSIKGLRLIPFSSVGNSHGLMLGIRAKEVVVDGVASDMIIAMAPEGLGNYEALIGGDDDTLSDRKVSEKIHIFDQFAALHRRFRCSSFTLKR